MWIDDQQRQLELWQSGWPPAVQWIGRTPILWPLRNAVMWGFGWFASAAALAGGYAIARRRVGSPGFARLLPVVLIAAQFVVVARQPNPYLRYLLPAYPALAIVAGAGLAWLLRSTDFSVVGRRVAQP